MIAALVAGAWVSFEVSAADFKIGDRTLSVPDAFEVELIAGPPLVDRPIALPVCIRFDWVGHTLRIQKV